MHDHYTIDDARFDAEAQGRCPQCLQEFTECRCEAADDDVPDDLDRAWMRGDDSMVECCDCHRPINPDFAEPIEDSRGYGPRLVCGECAERY